MRTLRELIPKKDFLASSGEGRGLLVDEKTIFYVCKRIVMEEYGARGAENIIPTFYKERKLYLTPKSSLWANEIWLQRKDLLNKINKELGQEVLVEIKLTEER